MIARGLPCAFLGVPPATARQHGNLAQPTRGTHRQRSVAARAFNLALVAQARRLGAACVDVFNELTDDRGEPNPAFFADGLHADPRALPLVMDALASIGWVSPGDPAMIAAGALALVPPPREGAPMHGGLEDERACRQVLVELAVSRCAAMGARRIAIYGAGRHTLTMGISPFTRAGMRVEAILSDDATNASMFGIAVSKPEQLGRSVDAIVISSDAHERAMLERAKLVWGRRVPVVPIYTWQGWAGVASSDRATRSKARAISGRSV
jgi:hypothetical protein